MDTPEIPLTNVAIAVIQHRDRLLICQRRMQGTSPGLWEFPGGKCGPEESLPDCLHRELREELAISVRIEESLAPILHRYSHGLIRLHPFLCGHPSGDPQPLACQAIRWVHPAQLRDFTFPSANTPLINQLQRRFASTDPTISHPRSR